MWCGTGTTAHILIDNTVLDLCGTFAMTHFRYQNFIHTVFGEPPWLRTGSPTKMNQKQLHDLELCLIVIIS